MPTTSSPASHKVLGCEKLAHIVGIVGYRSHPIAGVPIDSVHKMLAIGDLQMPLQLREPIPNSIKLHFGEALSELRAPIQCVLSARPRS